MVPVLRRQKQGDLCKCKASLVCRVSDQARRYSKALSQIDKSIAARNKADAEVKGLLMRTI